MQEKQVFFFKKGTMFATVKRILATVKVTFSYGFDRG
jgi:hypothetical protein